MANQQKGELSLRVNDRVYTLRPSLNALCVAEERTGRTTSDLMLAAGMGSMNATRTVLWSYLQKYHAADFKTFDQVGDLIDEAGLDEINRQLQKLMEINQPPVDATALAAEGAGRPPEGQDGSGVH